MWVWDTRLDTDVNIDTDTVPQRIDLVIPCVFLSPSSYSLTPTEHSSTSLPPPKQGGGTTQRKCRPTFAKIQDLFFVSYFGDSRGIQLGGE